MLSKKQRTTAFRNDNPHLVTKNFWGHIKRRYSLESDDYIELFNTQNGVCYTCKTKCKLTVDHDHSTGTVRKLLCYRCNAIAGAIEDDKYESVLHYLKEHQE